MKVPSAALKPGSTKDRLDAWRRLYEFTALSSDWQVVHRWGYGERVAAAVAEDVRCKLMLAPKDRVLEVGCASGVFLSMVLGVGQDGIGFDLCEALVRRSADFGIDRARLRLGVAEAARLPLASNFFDKVFCYSIFQCFPSPAYARQTIAEFLRVCKPGGLILLGDIFGIMEKQRQWLSRHRSFARVADALLWPLAPLWHAKQIAPPTAKIRRRAYRRGFFRRAIAGQHCNVEFLLQKIPGRRVSNSRYDVRIHKFGPISDAGVSQP